MLGTYLDRGKLNLGNIPTHTKEPVQYRYAVVYRAYRAPADSTPCHVTFDTIAEAMSFSAGLRRLTSFNSIFRLDPEERMTDALAWDAYNTPARLVTV